MNDMRQFILAAVLISFFQVFADQKSEAMPPALVSCTKIDNESTRLRCFDHLVNSWSGNRKPALVTPSDRYPSSKNMVPTSNRENGVLKYLSREVDTIDGITWYHAKNLRALSVNEAYRQFAGDNSTAINALSDYGKTQALLRYSSPLRIYLGQSNTGGSPWLRWVMTYAGNDWLFVNRCKIVVDKKPFELSLNDKVQRNVREGAVFETVDMKLSAQELIMIEAIANSKEAVIRFYGRNGVADHTVQEPEKRAIKHIISHFKQLGGKDSNGH